MAEMATDSKVPVYPVFSTQKVVCSHCNYPGHTKDNCYKLIGYPIGYFDKPKTSTHHHSAAVMAGHGKIGMALQISSFISADTWIIDSGASDHMTYDKSYFHHFTTPNVSSVTNANGASFPVLGTGSIRVTPSLELHNVLYVPALSHHLISVPQLNAQSNCSLTFFPMYALFQDLITKEIIGRGYMRRRLFRLDQMYAGENPEKRAHAGLASNSTRESEIWLWHRHLGHPSFHTMKKLMPSLFIAMNVSDFHCETCVLAKSHRVSYPPSISQSAIPFELIHSDVWGPSKVPTRTGMRYYVLFIDDCTRLSWVVFLKSKSDVFGAFQAFRTLIQTQFNGVIRVLRSDNGGEYVSHEFQKFCQTHGIIHQTTCPQTPEQNGVSERKNRHLLEIARSLLFSAHMPKYLWDEAVRTASHLINRLPSSVLNGRIPYEVLSTHVSIPSFHNLPARVFGCVAFVHIPQNQRTKLDARALKCVLVGYGTHQKGYKCYHPPTQKYFVTMDVTFYEDTCYFIPHDNTPLQGEKGFFEEMVVNGDQLLVGGSIGRDEHNVEVAEEERKEDEFPGDRTTPRRPDGFIDAEGSVAMELPGVRTDLWRPDGLIGSELPVAIETPGVRTEMLCPDGMIIPEGPETETEPNEDNEVPLPLPSSAVPPEHDFQGAEDPLEVIPMTESTQYTLPNRLNRGKPAKKYEPTVHAKAKYPVADFISTHRLSKSYESFVNQISAVSVPNKVQDALSDPKWSKAREEEMEALQKNDTWELVPPSYGFLQ